MVRGEEVKWDELRERELPLSFDDKHKPMIRTCRVRN